MPVAAGAGRVYDHADPGAAHRRPARRHPAAGRQAAGTGIRGDATTARRPHTSSRPNCACIRAPACGSCACAPANRRCCVPIRISRRWRAMPGWPPTAACRRSASRPARRRGAGHRFPAAGRIPRRRPGALHRLEGHAAPQRSPSSARYQDERDQSVWMLIDCGRRMRAEDPEGPSRQRPLRPGAERGDADDLRGAA